MESKNDKQITIWSERKEEHELMIERAKILAKSDLLPPAFRDKPANIMVALDIARELSLSPLMVMQSMYIIHGKPSFSSSFILALLYKSKAYRSLDFEFSDDRKSCRMVATKKEDGVVLEGPVVSLAMAASEGWLSKAGSKWKTMPDLMLRYRAATFFCRTCAPHLLYGFHTLDEVQDIAPPSAPASQKEEEVESIKTSKSMRKTIQDIMKEINMDDYE